MAGEADGGLRRDAVGLREVLFQSITPVALAAAVAASPPSGAAFVGEYLPLSVLITLVACLFTASCVAAPRVVTVSGRPAVAPAPRGRHDHRGPEIVELVKGLASPWPPIASDTRIVPTDSARPMEDAFRIPQLNLVQWLVRHCGFSALDAYRFAPRALESPLANARDTNHTCVAKVRKGWLPERETHPRCACLTSRDHSGPSLLNTSKNAERHFPWNVQDRSPADGGC
jgi:hypothetical protein